MQLKMMYKYNGKDEAIEVTCSNYTFGLPKLFYTFQQRHPEGLKQLEKDKVVTDVVIRSFYSGEWRTLQKATISFK